MNIFDSFGYIINNLKNYKLRTSFIILSVSIGIFLVIILSSLIEGSRLYVLREFLELGSNLIIVIPGKVETTGALPWGGITKDLKIEDFLALRKQLPEFKIAAPVVVSTEKVKYKNKARSVPILGTTREYFYIRNLKALYGDFLPSENPEDFSYLIVLGYKVSKEIFGFEKPIGKIVKLGDTRFKVCGILMPKGKLLGFDLDDIAFIPVKTSMKMFNKNSLFRIVLKAPLNSNVEEEKKKVLNFFKKIHRVEDVTVITQESVLNSFSNIMRILSYVLTAVATISLFVAGLGIMNMMLISVSERVQEIGILRACGGLKKHILLIFIREAVLLSFLGALSGIILSLFSLFVFHKIFPAFPLKTPTWAFFSAILLAISTGTFFGFFPAYKASNLDPIEALRKR